jgi:type IV pilus assembly protein PilA
MLNPTRQRGFTIIELLIVIAILGILSIMAIPAYGSFVARQQANEGVQLTSGWRQSISLYHARKGVWPTVNDLNDILVVTNLSSRNVKAVSLGDKGVIEVTFGGRETNSQISGRVLELVPYVGPNGDADWKCHASSAWPADVLPDFCRNNAR